MDACAPHGLRDPAALVGALMWIATAAQCREMDRRAQAEFGLTVLELMERSGSAASRAVAEMLPRGGRVTVFCGKGNNGGDGLVVARLSKAAGYCVECLVAALEPELGECTAEQVRLNRAAGIEPMFRDDPRWGCRSDCVGCRDLIVDALLGTGASGEISGTIREAIESINRSGVPVVSVDIPSGIDCDTGDELGESVRACRTVTLGAPKPFLFQGAGLEHSGCWNVADIGLPRAILDAPTDAMLIGRDYACDLLPERLRSSHKGENGSVLIVAGSRRMPGAASLAARAALRAGAGLVTVASVASVCAAVAANVPEAVLLPLDEESGVVSLGAVGTLLDHQRKFDAAVFGPGLTHDEPVQAFLSALWSDWTVPSVIDADALTMVGAGLPLPAGACVLTPHAAEMGRLLISSVAEIQADRLNAVRDAVGRFGKTILLKGPYSVVGSPDEPMLVNSTGNPGMASGGMGDVLSGVMATLLAQQLPTYQAAGCGMYWHGLAGDRCVQEIGPVGFTASDVADALPRARATITEACEPE